MPGTEIEELRSWRRPFGVYWRLQKYSSLGALINTCASTITRELLMEPVYKEDVFNRDADRREIARILEGKRLHTRQPTTSTRSRLSFFPEIL
ncbi:hypothetical protein BDV29DRAFT_100130 [Aspergillus leporis]|uniref:Uncharacterized protein n=1 Tax=Aspergillus leporis TaxID=41062 RepID=A0A5N5XEL1_9EURO|nr:hypothetical protein BDV29DRAFT_100130 [Aspergillus leporis]